LVGLVAADAEVDLLAGATLFCAYPWTSGTVNGALLTLLIEDPVQIKTADLTVSMSDGGVATDRARAARPPMPSEYVASGHVIVVAHVGLHRAYGTRADFVHAFSAFGGGNDGSLTKSLCCDAMRVV